MSCAAFDSFSDIFLIMKILFHRKLLSFLFGIAATHLCSAQVVEPRKNKEDYDNIFTKLEITTSPRGGYDSWKRYVDSSLSGYRLYFPTNDSVSQFIDSVTIKFIVNKDGQLSDFQVISGSNLFVNDLAVELLKHSGKWHPGENGNRLLTSLRTFSIKFEISYSEKRIKYLPSQKDYWRRND